MRQELSVPREELHRELWSEPARLVTERHGISDVGLAKICVRYGIPKPGVGYWARRQFGKAPAVEPLPPPPEGVSEVVTFRISDQADEYPDSPEYRREKDPEWRIEVPDDLRLSHPLVRAADTALRRRLKPRDEPVHWNDRYRVLLRRPGKGCLDIAVSRPLIPRALRIMQTLLVAFGSRGYPVSMTAKGATTVGVLGEEFQIALTERFRQVRVQHRYGASLELEPSGRLHLRIGPDYSGSGMTDDPPRLIEGRLNRFVRSLVRRAFTAKRERAVREDRERRWLLHEETYRREEQERASEALRRRLLRALANRWARHERLAQFVTDVERRVSDKCLDGDAREVAARWIEWARGYLDENDPRGDLLKEPWPSAPLPPPRPMPWSWE